MDVRQFRYFVTIVDCGSVSKAAELLYISQPSLSQQMANLENEVETKLLIRSSQGVIPTEAGKVLYQHARSVLRQVAQARQDVKRGGFQEAGHVSVGLPTSIAAVLAIPLLSKIRTEFPNITLHILGGESGHLTEMLITGRLDMAFLFRDAETRGLSIHPLVDEELFVYGRFQQESSAESKTCPMQHLNGIPLMLPSSSQGLRALIERSFNRHGVQLNVIAEVDSLPTIIEAAEAGLACTILPSSSLKRRDRSKQTPIRRLVEPCIRRPVSLCWPNSIPRISAAIAVHQVILQLVTDLVAEHIWKGAHLRTEHGTVCEL